MIELNIFTLSSIFAFVMCCIVASYVYWKGKKRPLNKTFAVQTFLMGTWCLFPTAISLPKPLAVFFVRGVYLAAIFNIPAFTKFCFTLLGVHEKRVEKNVLALLYWWALFLAILIPSPLFLKDVEGLSIPYLLQESTVFILFAFSFIVVCLYNFFRLIKAYWASKGVKRNQYKYFIIAFNVAFLGAVIHIYHICARKDEILPHDMLLITYAVICAYAIIKYRLMDVTVAITRTGIFVCVYSIVLGIPFALAFGWQEQLKAILGDNWWIVPLVSSTVLATAGPFIYLFMQRKAEDKIYEEQRRYQTTLRQASSGMSRIKDLKKLLNLIVHIVNRTVHLEHTSIYLYDKFEKKYFLEATRGGKRPSEDGTIDPNSPLAKMLLREKEPIVYEEIKHRAQDYKDKKLAQVEEQLEELDAALAVPSLIEDKLLAIVILGKRKSGKLFTNDDLSVFAILANQAALAIENALFYEDAQKTQEQLFQAEKMATIGTMADGLSHQINNRLHALGFIAGDALDSINLKENVKVSPEIKDLLNEIKYSLERIQQNVKQGGEIVEGLLKYTRKGESGFTSVDLKQLIKSSLEMASYKVKLDQLSIVKDFPEDLPQIHGNFTQLQEVFFNIIDNAYDAIMQRKNEKKEPDFKGTIHMSAKMHDEKLEISVVDNGIGVKDEDQAKLFTPFFTTKTSTKKGTGLGLYVIQKIIEDNHKGKVSVSSEYMTGTLFTIRLPIVE